MSRKIKVRYEGGVLKPEGPVELAEHQEAYVTLEKAAKAPGAPEYTGPFPRKFSFMNLGRSGYTDTAERHREIVAAIVQEKFGAKREK